MDRICRAVAIAFLVCVPCFAIYGYGTRWTFGRYAMPRSLVGPDRLHYRNGDEIDPLTSGFIRRDCEEEVMLTVFGILLISCFVLLVELRHFRRSLMRQCAMQVEEAVYGRIRDPQAWLADIEEQKRRKWQLWPPVWRGRPWERDSGR